MTEISRTAAPIATTGIPAATTAYSNQATSAQPIAGRQAPVTPNASVATTYSSTPATTAVTGGGFIEDLSSVVSRIVVNANNGAKALQEELAATLNSNKTMDPAKLQDINWRMSQFEMQQQQAAKLQEKQERMIALWVRP